MKYKNPVLSGYNPDPSICRVGEDYYIVNSTFEFFPGVPIYHSRNLVNWELQGYCLTDSTKLPLEKCRPSGGIFAPTLRYHQGTFFMTTTNVTGGGNFIVHTRDMKAGWSDPVWVKQGGIDPSLFFDENGKVYFTSTGVDESGRAGIYMCEIDPFTGEMLTESVLISYGCGGKCPEGPHIYKLWGKYYLMLAEGGTEYGHMETMQRADDPYGPYEPCPHNPILSHKELRHDNIYCTGHADIIEDQNGNWWLVCLGVRTCSDEQQHVMLHNLGRETFLAPVVWDEEGWPVVGENGVLSGEMEGPLPGQPRLICRDFQDDFSEEAESLHYNYLRNPDKENYTRDVKNRQLILKGTQVTLNEQDSPTWIGIRQKGFDITASVKVSMTDSGDGARAGLCAYYNDSYHYEIYLTRGDAGWEVCLAKHIHDIFSVTDSATISSGENIVLKMDSDKEYYRFSYSTDRVHFRELGRGLTVGLCTETTKTMTFTGTYIAMFSENGKGIFKDFQVKVLDY